jgi:hypothetical protein
MSELAHRTQVFVSQSAQLTGVAALFTIENRSSADERFSEIFDE